MMNIADEIRKTHRAIAEVLADNNIHYQIELASQICERALRNGNKILLCGNGGSAADAQHLAAEFVSRLNFDRPGLSAIALTTDTSALTAIGNDYGFENIFSRQLNAIGRTGDVLIAISTSGNSPNVLKAIEAAHTSNIKTIGLTGKSGGKMKCNLLIKIPSDSTQNIQECHIMAGHIIAGLVEERVFR